MTAAISTPSSPAQLAGALVQSLQQQVELYGKLDQLCARQHDLVQRGDAEQLLNVLGARQKIIAELTRVALDAVPLRELWKKMHRDVAAPDRQQVHGLLDQVEAMLARIMAQDETDGASLRGNRDKIAAELRQTADRRRVASAYRAAPPSNTSSFTSQQG